MVRQGHNGMRKCLPRDKWIIARNPLLFEKLDVGREGVVYTVSFIMCSWKTSYSAKCTKNNRTYGGKVGLGQTAQHLFDFITTVSTKTLTILFKLLAWFNHSWLVSLAALNPGTPASLRCRSWRAFIAERDYFPKN